MDEEGVVSDLWSTNIQAPGSQLVDLITIITGGIMIRKIGKEKQMTPAILQSFTFTEWQSEKRRT